MDVEALWAILFMGATVYIAFKIYLSKTPTSKIKRYQYCTYCGKVMMLKYRYMFDGKMLTYLQCSVADYANNSEEARKHSYVYLKEGDPDANYNATTGAPLNKGKR